MVKSDSEKPKRLALISTRGTLDWAYPPFILATAGAAMGWEVAIFFTFYGLPLLKHKLDAKVSPLGNPAMPMSLPFGPQAVQDMDLPIPTALMSIPGFNNVATGMMKQLFSNKGVASIEQLRDMSVDLDVRLIACQMTMEVFGFEKDDFIPETEVAGAGAFLDFAADSDVQLFT
jgi:peroxiredoxin family protein